MNHSKSLYEKARNIPIKLVADRFGGKLLEKNMGGSQKLSINGRIFVVSSTGYGWFEIGGKSGSGAIDLVMLLNNCDRHAALNFLLEIPFASPLFIPTSGFSSTLSSAIAMDEISKPDFVASKVPIAVPTNWPKVRAWLINVRGLDPRIIDQLHEVDIIYADSFANAIFICNDGSTNLGCELRGTGNMKFAGRRGYKGLFELEPTIDSAPIAIVESAIDAISLRQLGYTGRIISTGGALSAHAISHLKLLPGPYLACFDADEAGDGYSERLSNSLNGTTRMRPNQNCKDWNDVLLHGASIDMPSTLT